MRKLLQNISIKREKMKNIPTIVQNTKKNPYTHTPGRLREGLTALA